MSLKAKSSIIQDHLKFVYCILDRKQPILNLNWDKANSFEKELKNSNGDIIRPETINLLEPRCFKLSYFICKLHHEITHARQEYFIEGNPFHPAAIVFRINLNYTISPSYYDLYRASPIEKHAQSAEQNAQFLLESIGCAGAAPAAPESPRASRHRKFSFC